VFTGVLLLMWFFADPFVSFIAPGFDEATHRLTVRLLTVLLPSFLLLFLVDLCTSMLHALKHFLAPALLRVVAPSVTATTIIIGQAHLGIFSLALGTVIGAAAQFVILALTLRSMGLRYRFVFAPSNKDFQQLLLLVYPFIFSVLMTQAAGIVYRVLVSDLSAGSLSALKFSEKIYQLFVIMFLSAVTTVVYPLLSEKAGLKDYAGMRETLAGSMRLITLVTVPIVIGVALLRQPLIQLLFERGEFTSEATTATAIALFFMVIGLTINGISSVAGHAVLALKATRISVAVSVTSQFVAIGLFFVLVPRMGHAGLALAGSLVPIAITGLYLLYLRTRIPRLGQILWHKTYAKLSVLGVGLALMVWQLDASLASSLSESTTSLVVRLVGGGVLGGGAYFVAARLWRIQEMDDVLALVRKKTR